MNVRQQWQRLAIEGEEVTYVWPDSGNSRWTVTTSWPRLGKQGPEVELEVRLTRTTDAIVVPRRRVSLESNSGAGSVLADMKRYAKAVRPSEDQLRELVPQLEDAGVHGFWSEFISDLGHLYRDTDVPGPLNLDLVHRDRSRSWVFPGLWPSSGVAGLSASGQSGKSYLSVAVMLSLASGHNMLQRFGPRTIPQRRVLYLDFEAQEADQADRIMSLLRGFGYGEDISEVMDNINWYKLTGKRLVDVVSKAKSYIAREEIEAVVIDSMSASIGEGLIDDAVVNAYWDAVMRLGVPVLVLTHKSKADKDRRNANIFGSVMSENRLRIAWNLERELGGKHMLLTCFKDNNTGMYGKSIGFLHEVESNPEDGSPHKATIWAVSPDEARFAIQAADKSQQRESEGREPTQLDRLVEYLESRMHAESYHEIAEGSGIPTGTIKRIISEHKELFARSGSGREVRYQLVR